MKTKRTATPRGKVGRPATGRTGKPVKLYIDTELRGQAAKHAFKKNKSLSGLVTQLLQIELGLPVTG